MRPGNEGGPRAPAGPVPDRRAPLLLPGRTAGPAPCSWTPWRAWIPPPISPWWTRASGAAAPTSTARPAEAAPAACRCASRSAPSVPTAPSGATGRATPRTCGWSTRPPPSTRPTSPSICATSPAATRTGAWRTTPAPRATGASWSTPGAARPASWSCASAIDWWGWR